MGASTRPAGTGTRPRRVRRPAAGRRPPWTTGVVTAAAVSLALVLTSPLEARGDITLLDFPLELVSIDEWFTVSWAEPVRCRIDYGWAPGQYTESTVTEGVQSLTITAEYEGIEPGVHYCVLVDVDTFETSAEFTLIVESPLLPDPTAPPTGSVIHETTTFLEWDPVDAVPYYHVIVSDTEAEIREEDGELVLDGANVIWQAITGGTAIQYGSIDPSGHFVASNGISPPLMSGFDYNWFVLNNYGNHPLLTSVVGAGVSSFTTDVVVDMAAPTLLSPPDSVAITSDLIEFEWESVSGAAGYYLYIHERRLFAGGEASYPIWSGATTEPRAEVRLGSFLATGEYRWLVVAIDQVGRGVASAKRGFAYAQEVGTARVVTEEAGQPVPWVLTEIEFLGGGIDLIPVVTDEDGVAEKDLIPGDYLLHATKQGYVDTTALATIVADQTEIVTIEIRRAPARIRGLVDDEDGEPVFGAEISASRGGDTVGGVSDANGNFVVTVTPGTWTVVAEKHGYEPAGPETVTVSAGSYVEVEEPLTLIGSPGTVTGNVLSHAGSPVAGATVRAEGDHGAFATTTGSSGRFTLELSQGLWWVWAEKSGFQPSDLREIILSPGGAHEIDPPIALEPIASAIMGRVTDGTTDIVGASVLAVPPSGEPLEVVTNGYGEFVLLPPASTYSLTATHEGLGRSSPHQVTVGSGESFTGVELLVEPLDSAVSGTVLSSGSGVEGAAVFDGRATTVTGSGGAFLFQAPAGVHALRASKPGYLTSPPTLVGTKPDQALAGITLEIAEGAGSISGRVTADGAPVAEARVRAESSGSTAEARTDHAGEFSLPVDAGEWTVTASKDGFRTPEPPTVLLAAGQSATGVELALEDESAVLRGSITDARAPVRRATILLFEDGAAEPSYRTSSSANGQYAIRVARDTDYALEASADEHGSRRFEVPGIPAGATETLHLSLPAHDGSITGTATGRAGAPLRHARIVASWGDSAAARTDRFGTYTVWLDDGLYDVRVECPGYRAEVRQDVEVVSGVATGLDFELDAVFANVAGTAADSLSGAPLEGVLVTASWQGGAASAATDGAGAYELDSVVPGEVSIQASRLGYRPATADLTLGESQSLALDVRLLELTGTIAGTVLEVGAGGIEGVAIRARLGDTVASTSWSDAGGHYVLAGLDPELSYDVHASRPGFYAESQNPLPSVPTGTLDADFTMRPSTGRIAGLVVDAADLSGLSGATVTAADGLGHFGSATSGPDGSFAIEALPAIADYDVTATLFGYFDATVEGVAPATDEIEVALPRNFARVSGRLVAEGEGVDFAEIRVVATSTAYGGESALAQPDPAGDYEIAEIRPGSYIVSVTGPGYVSTPAQVALSIGEGDIVPGVEFTVALSPVERVEVTGPTLIEAGDVIVYSADAFAADDRLVDATTTWWVSPTSAGEIEPETGHFSCDHCYLGEFTVAAREPGSGVVGRLACSAYATLGPSTEAEFADSAGMRLSVGPGAVAETKTVYLSHESAPDSKRLARDFEVRGLIHHLKPDGLAFDDGHLPTLTLPRPATGAEVVRWNGDTLSWQRLSAEETAAGLAVAIASLGEYATITDSRGLGVSGITVRPNPFSPDNGPVEISFDLSSNRARMPFVTVTVYNMAGLLVRRVTVDEPLGKGRVSVEWDGRTDDAELARNGRYVIEIGADDPGGDAKGLATMVLVK